ncbi:hypothetical protein F5Y17DRAFT_470210 [Xylariaceae sp. FL0594]|nr:hypothetical protein F5Y17DRAFT_470210 [Xylariaceae sp. FL0594]
MGGKVWSEPEERHFWHVAVAQSPKRAGVDLARAEKSWDDLAKEMQVAMGTMARRQYSGTMLFEHYFQNIESQRRSPNAGIYVREYLAKKRLPDRDPYTTTPTHVSERRQYKLATRFNKILRNEGDEDDDATRRRHHSQHYSTPLGFPVFGPGQAFRAVALGATRIELNARGSYSEGGTTPSLQDLESVITDLNNSNNNIPLRIMIRPRGPPPGQKSERDFIYTDEELASMLESIRVFKTAGWLDVRRGDGFVFGVLKEKQEGEGGSCSVDVDVERCALLAREARPFKSIFHRAYDELVSHDTSPTPAHWQTGLQRIAACGFDGVLTSGGLGRAIDNVATLREIIRAAEGLGLEIIVGGGVRTENVGELVKGLGESGGGVYLHSACLEPGNVSGIDEREVRGILGQVAELMEQ